MRGFLSTMTSVDAKETQEKQVNAVPESKEPAPIATTEASEKAPAKQDEDEEEYNEDEDEDFVRGRLASSHVQGLQVHRRGTPPHLHLA